MTGIYTQTEVLQLVRNLTSERLQRYLSAELVMPRLSDNGPAFRGVDVARLELLCDLDESYGLDTDALGLVLALIDRLHAARARLDALADAISREPADVRERIGRALAGLDDI